MAIVLSGTTNDITVNGVSVATDMEVSSAVANGVAPKANITDLKEIGVGQTWQDVTASRSVGVAYTNSTGKPIYLYVRMGIGAYDLHLTINGTIYFNMSNNNGRGSVQAIVPNGSTYAISGAFNVWNELR